MFLHAWRYSLGIYTCHKLQSLLDLQSSSMAGVNSSDSGITKFLRRRDQRNDAVWLVSFHASLRRARNLTTQQSTTRFVSHGARALMPNVPSPKTWDSKDFVNHVPAQFQVDHYFELHVRQHSRAYHGARLTFTAYSYSTWPSSFSIRS